jgi:hypothetical protein
MQRPFELHSSPSAEQVVQGDKQTYETLKHLKNMTRTSDYIMVSFDLTEGYYTLGIREMRTWTSLR